MHKLKLKKETKHTAVYESEDPLSPLQTAYVQKSWLAADRKEGEALVPRTVEIEVHRPRGEGGSR